MIGNARMRSESERFRRNSFLIVLCCNVVASKAKYVLLACGADAVAGSKTNFSKFQLSAIAFLFVADLRR